MAAAVTKVAEAAWAPAVAAVRGSLNVVRNDAATAVAVLVPFFILEAGAIISIKFPRRPPKFSPILPRAVISHMRTFRRDRRDGKRAANAAEISSGAPPRRVFLRLFFRLRKSNVRRRKSKPTKKREPFCPLPGKCAIHPKRGRAFGKLLPSTCFHKLPRFTILRETSFVPFNGCIKVGSVDLIMVADAVPAAGETFSP